MLSSVPFENECSQGGDIITPQKLKGWIEKEKFIFGTEPLSYESYLGIIVCSTDRRRETIELGLSLGKC